MSADDRPFPASSLPLGPETLVEPTLPVAIRRVVTLAEYNECVAIECETWGDQFTERVSATVLRIAQEVGGVTAAAFDASDRMLGFVFGLTGVRDGELAHWSDMLAVRPEAQRLGIGTRLKHFQRELLLEIGVRTMYWTYDPLVARNAHLNLVRLGARVTQYRVNFYGENTGSVVHAGLGTDRFIVAWDLTRRPAHTTDHLPPGAAGATVVDAVRPGREGPVVEDLPHADIVRVAVPDDIFAVLAERPAVARAWRDTTRQAFEHYLGSGYHVATFVRRGAGDAYGSYRLRRTEPDNTTRT